MWTPRVQIEDVVAEGCVVREDDPERTDIVLRLSDAPHEPWQEEFRELLELGAENRFDLDDLEFQGDRLSFSVNVGSVDDALDYVSSACGNANERYQARFADHLEAQSRVADQVVDHFAP